MKFFKNEDISKKGLAVRLACLVLAILMLLASCGEDTATASKKKKKKVVVVKKPDSSNTESSGDDDDDNFVYDEDDEDEEEEEEEEDKDEEEDEGEDLKKEPDVDHSDRSSHVPSQYSNLVFAEEFEGTALNLDIWTIQTSETRTDVYQANIPEMLGVYDGELHLTTRRWFDPYDEEIKYATPPDVHTTNGMCWRYGYLELCAKIPLNSAVWSAFWMCTRAEHKEDIYDYMIEIDMIETFGSYNTIVPNLHKWYSPTGKQKNFDKWKDVYNLNSINDCSYLSHTQNDYRSPYKVPYPENFSKQYHTYAFEWTDTYMAWYFDGVEYDRYDFATRYDSFYFSKANKSENGTDMSNFVDSKQMMWFIIGNGAISPQSTGDIGTGFAPSDADYPAEMAVDWIRIYHDPNQKDNLIQVGSEQVTNKRVIYPDGTGKSEF